MWTSISQQDQTAQYSFMTIFKFRKHLVNPELLPQRFFLSEGQIAIGPGLVDGDRLTL